MEKKNILLLSLLIVSFAVFAQPLGKVIHSKKLKEIVTETPEGRFRTVFYYDSAQLLVRYVKKFQHKNKRREELITDLRMEYLPAKVNVRGVDVYVSNYRKDSLDMSFFLNENNLADSVVIRMNKYTKVDDPDYLKENKYVFRFDNSRLTRIVSRNRSLYVDRTLDAIAILSEGKMLSRNSFSNQKNRRGYVTPVLLNCLPDELHAAFYIGILGATNERLLSESYLYSKRDTVDIRYLYEVSDEGFVTGLNELSIDPKNHGVQKYHFRFMYAD